MKTSMSGLCSDAMIDALDKTYGANWRLWRAGSGEWCVKVGDFDRDTLTAKTLSDALNAACNHKILPVIPRRPLVPARESFQIKASGGWYEVLYREHFCYRERRKSDAVANLNHMIGLDRERQEKWDNEHAHFVATHIEGVDFVYSH